MAGYRYHGSDEAERRIDALDLIEGVLQDGFSLSSFRRIVQARGPNFWIGAAIGAAVVVIATKSEARAAVASFFRPDESSRHSRDPVPPADSDVESHAPSSGGV